MSSVVLDCLFLDVTSAWSLDYFVLCENPFIIDFVNLIHSHMPSSFKGRGDVENSDDLAEFSHTFSFFHGRIDMISSNKMSPRGDWGYFYSPRLQEIILF